MRKLPQIGMILLALALVGGGANHAYAGFGVSPSKIIENRLIKGSVLERTIYLVQGTPDKDLSVEVTIDDTDIKDWIQVEPGGKFIIPKGIQQFPVTVRVKVPDNASLGIYRGFVRAVGAPAAAADVEQGQSGVSIAVGARVDLELEVGEGIHYEYAIRDIDVKNIKEIEPPKADINLENKGNVPAAPAEASFELFNKYGDIRLAYVQGVKIEKVPAFTTRVITVEFPISVGLSVGEYWGTVKLYNEKGGVVREFKDIFNVNQATFLDKFGKYILISLGVIAFLVVGFVILRLVRRPKFE